jgi:hypothetical protein
MLELLVFWSDEFRFLKADGTYGIFYDRGVISRDETGKAVRLNGVIEITELKNIKINYLIVKRNIEVSLSKPLTPFL